MKNILTILTVFLLCNIAGCGNKNILNSSESDGLLLKVKFQEGKTLRYRFVCEREIIIESNPGQSTQSAANKSTEKMDLFMSYTPIEINPDGLTTIKALCEDVEIIKSKSTTKDAAEYFVGKSFNFTIDSSGRIQDYTELNELIKQAGEKAFSSGTNSNRTKNPDMINDFIATQWFLWDSIASIPNELQDSTISQKWKSKLSVPTPMVSRWARDVTYQLTEIQSSENRPIAIIDSVYEKSDSAPKSWPVPYSGRFQMRGTFGLLRGYKLIELKGQGRELFNIDLGQIREYKQKYDLVIQASVLFGMSVKPIINIKQTISMELI